MTQTKIEKVITVSLKNGQHAAYYFTEATTPRDIWQNYKEGNLEGKVLIQHALGASVVEADQICSMSYLDPEKLWIEPATRILVEQQGAAGIPNITLT